ncbi:MAG: Fe-S cluster assembly protein SufD [Candidatus Micrarchaeia archaeon]|jgi:Fe-S cluster assembly protein SufD
MAEWFEKSQKQALSLAKKMPFPQEHDSPIEKFYTNMSSLKLDEFEAAEAEVKIGKAAGRKIIISDLKSALKEHGKLIEKKLGTLVKPEEHKLSALCAGTAGNGVFIYAPAGAQLDEPLLAEIVGSESGALYASRTIIIAEKGSRVRYYEKRKSGEKSASLHLGTVEVFAEEGAQVSAYGMHNISGVSSDFTIKRARIGAGAKVDWFNAHFGARQATSTIDSVFAGEGASGTNLTVFFNSGSQHCDISSNALHEAPNTSSNMLSRGAVTDEATSVYRGLIKIAKEAKNAQSYLTANALLLSERARANSIPSLVIDTNEVHSKHGATVGHLDEEQLFYLMSRGLGKKLAEHTMVEGFFEHLLAKLEVQGIKGEMVEEVARRMG